MKIERFGAALAVALAAGAVMADSLPDTRRVPVQMVVTALPPGNLEAGGLTVVEGKTPAPVVRLERLRGDLADMQLFILLDDSTRSTSFGQQFPELKTFIASLPTTTEVAIGYMRNGTVAMAQAFTGDHQKAAKSLRLPLGMPGINGSPYFAFSDLMQHWPSKQSATRKAVLMLTDGVDRYYGSSTLDDPYVDAAAHDALKHGVMVYAIYLHGAGLYARGNWSTNTAQSRLMQVSDTTGGYAYFEAFSDPVSIAPFLKDLRERMENQYRVTIQAVSDKGVQAVKVRAESPAIKVTAPTHIYVQ